MQMSILFLFLTAHVAVAFRLMHTGKNTANAAVLRRTRDPASYAPCGKKAWADAPVITLLSGTGEGKSTISDVLARDPWMARVAEETQAESETSESCIYQAHWFYPYDRSEPMTIVDTPGFGDTRSDMIEKNNAGIVSTLKLAKRLNVVIWALNANKPKVEQARQQAFKFVRSYFGKQMYKHLVFVYTRFQWRKTGRFGDESGEKRKEFLTELHQNIITGLLREVESQFWPDGKISEEMEGLLRGAPYFGINAYVQEYDNANYLSDADMKVEEYDRSAPDGADGVYNPEKSFKPNSATQLLDLKKEINQVWENEDPADTRHLRPYDTYCKRASTTLDSELSTILGSRILDCFFGELWKTLIEEVIPRLKEMTDGNVKAVMGIKANVDAMAGFDGSQIYDQAYNLINEHVPLDETALEAISSFTSFENYESCFEIPTLVGQPQAKALYRCIGGIRAGKNPRLVKMKIFMGYFDTIRPETAKQIEANVKLLPDHEREAIMNSPHAPDFEKLTKNENLEKIGELNDAILDLTRQMEQNRDASEKEREEWNRRLAELRAQKDKELADLKKDLEKATAPSPGGGGGKR